MSTPTDEPQYVDPDSWFERLYDAALPDTHAVQSNAAQNRKAEPMPADSDEQAEDDGRPFNLRALADQLSDVLSETPEDRDQRLHTEREAKFISAGETTAQRRQRHRSERREQEHRASLLLRVHHSERTRRFRRWVALTALSASVGYACDLVQIAGRLPLNVGVAALGGCWWLDLYLRRWGRIRVSQVRGPLPLALLIVARVPLASLLAALLGLAPLFALPHHH